MLAGMSLPPPLPDARASRASFPSVAQALLLLGLLFAAELLLVITLNPLQRRLGVGSESVVVLAIVAAHALVFTLATQWQGLSYRRILHASASSPAVVAKAMLPPVLMMVPAAVLLLVNGVQWLVWLVPMSDTEKALFAEMASNSLPHLLLACVLAPCLEEMLFRGVILQGFLARYPRGLAIWGSALLFGAAHLNLYQAVVGVLLGLVTGWLYERCRSLLPCIGLHAGYNAALVAIAASQDRPDQLPADFNAPLHWLLAALSLALALAWLHVLLAPRRRQDAQPD